MSDEIKIPKPEDVLNFPLDNPNARITRKSQHLYVTESYVRARNENGAKLCSIKIIGKIVKNHYYSMDEYHRLFKRNGEPKEPVFTKANRTYVRRKPVSEIVRKSPKYSTSIPDASTIKNYPHEVEGARIVKIGKVFYVVTTTYFRADGKNRHLYSYLGRVVDGEFFTTEQYKKLFKRNGERRDKSELTE